MEFPQDLRYSGEHTWARREGDRVTVGITDFAQAELGEVLFVELPRVGRAVSAGESFGVVESVKAVSDLVAPVSGEVVTVNPRLDEAPELVNQLPYGDGWMIVIEASNPAAWQALLSADDYQATIT
jgi:glycine cleavage system H protein